MNWRINQNKCKILDIFINLTDLRARNSTLIKNTIKLFHKEIIKNQKNKYFYINLKQQQFDIEKSEMIDFNAMYMTEYRNVTFPDL